MSSACLKLLEKDVSRRPGAEDAAAIIRSSVQRKHLVRLAALSLALLVLCCTFLLVDNPPTSKASSALPEPPQIKFSETIGLLRFEKEGFGQLVYDKAKLDQPNNIHHTKVLIRHPRDRQPMPFFEHENKAIFEDTGSGYTLAAFGRHKHESFKISSSVESSLDGDFGFFWGYRQSPAKQDEEVCFSLILSCTARADIEVQLIKQLIRDRGPIVTNRYFINGRIADEDPGGDAILISRQTIANRCVLTIDISEDRVLLHVDPAKHGHAPVNVIWDISSISDWERLRLGIQTFLENEPSQLGFISRTPGTDHFKQTKITSFSRKGNTR